MNDEVFYNSISRLLSKGWVLSEDNKTLTSPPMPYEDAYFILTMAGYI